MKEKDIWETAHKRIFDLYGDMPDLLIVSRFYSEKQAFMQYGVANYFNKLAMLRHEAENTGGLLIVNNAIASCFVAYLLGAVDESPLPAHYYCPKCKTVEWRGGECVLDLRERTCSCGERMLADGFDIPYMTYLPYAKMLKNDHHSLFQNSLSDVVSLCKRLERESGISTEKIDLNDNLVKEKILTASFDRLANRASENIIKKMIVDRKPKSYAELLKLIALAHGTYTWLGNAERLLANNLCSLLEIPATRDELFVTVRDAMLECGFSDTGFAFDTAEKARHGYYFKNGMDSYTAGTLQMLGFGDWFTDYLKSTEYMSTKALAVMELKYSIVLNWYKTYYPREYIKVVAE